MNKVILMGRLTADPEMRKTGNDISVCSFTLAVDRRFKTENGPSADFIRVVAWRQTADFVYKYFNKGNKLSLVGSIQTRTWDDNQGKRQYATEVIAEEVYFCESKNSKNNATTTEAGYNDGAEEEYYEEEYYEADSNETDIPF